MDNAGMRMQGWIEARYQEGARWWWQPVVSLATSLRRESAAALGLFFGISNGAGWNPVAPARGLPEDISPRARQDYTRAGDAFGATWALWSELRAVSPETEARAFSPWISEYEHVGGQAYRFVQRFTGASFLTAEEEARLAAGEEVWRHGLVYRRQRLRAREVLTPEWQSLFRELNTIAAHAGDEGVRVVVWFLAPPAVVSAPEPPAAANAGAAEWAPRRTAVPIPSGRPRPVHPAAPGRAYPPKR